MRQRKRKSQGSQIGSILIFFGAIILLAGVAYVIYTSRSAPPPPQEDPLANKGAYDSWLAKVTVAWQQKIQPIAAQLDPVCADQPAEERSPALTAKLKTQYLPVMHATGATYAWCQKGWHPAGKGNQLERIGDGENQFILQPSRSVGLGEPLSFTNLNAQAAQTGACRFYYDMDQKKVVAVVILHLAPVAGIGTAPVRAAGAPVAPAPVTTPEGAPIHPTPPAAAPAPAPAPATPTPKATGPATDGGPASMPTQMAETVTVKTSEPAPAAPPSTPPAAPHAGSSPAGAPAAPAAPAKAEPPQITDFYLFFDVEMPADKARDHLLKQVLAGVE